MNLALTEVRRQPGRFVVATVVLTFLATLLLFLGGLLDGLFLGSTGAIRAQRADAIVFSATSRESFLRSRITPDVRAQVEAVDGVRAVGGLGLTLLGAEVPGEDGFADVAVAGYEIAPRGVPDPPADGKGWADDRLRADGVSVGDVLLVGPERSPVEVIGFVEDTNYLLQAGLWVNLDTWRSVQNANRPDANVSAGVVQALVVQGTGGSTLRTAIDAATGGATVSLSREQAVFALPGVEQQEATFNQIIYSTLAVVLVVVGLFFSLLTLERTGLYGVLKAVGASSRRLFAGVALQAVVVALVAFVAGSLLALAAGAAVPPAVPLQLTTGRFVFTLVGLVVAAVIGSAISLRRITRIDPAAAIGAGT